NAHVKEPQFESQTKVRLTNPNVQGLVESIVGQQLSTFLEENPKVAEIILARAEQAKMLREQMKKFSLNARKKAFGGASFPTKLADCNCKETKGTEVYIVEGDSAGGSAKMGRDTYFQAILPIKGKIINVEKARMDKMLKNSEIESLLQVIIPDWHLEENKVVYTKVRYEKVIIMTDADIDGSHIRTLLLTFFFRYIPQLIEEGYLFIAQPPLFSVSKGGRDPKYYIYFKEMIRDYAFQGVKETLLVDKNNRVSFGNQPLKEILEIAHTLNDADELLNYSAQMDLNEWIKSTLQQDWKRPKYQIKFAPEIRYFHSDEELEIYFLQQKKIHPALEKINTEEKEFDSLKHKDYFQITNLTLSPITDKLAEMLLHLEKLEKLGLPLKNFLNGEFTLKSGDIKESIEIQSFKGLIKELSKIGQKGLEVKRYKGLGEMDPGELRKTTMEPKNRILKKVTMIDKHAVNLAFVMLMGTEVRDRRIFIESRAAKINWDLLDI
ncbi:MAG: toprim domain-containing protein, partial [Planctomycetota bacterium]